MAFRVVPGTPAQPGEPAEKTAPGQGLSVTSAGGGAVPASGGSDQVALVPLLERLETLSFTFEALNASSRTYAAEAVLETLGRMERRDLQALAAVETFASALKTVSQHLAGLRHAVQTSAHDTAIGFHDIAERLDRLENRFGANALPAASGGQLSLIADRLGAIEELVGQHGTGFDPSPIQDALEAMANKVEQIDEKMAELPDKIGTVAVDMTPVTGSLDSIAERVASVERKIDEAAKVDVTPLKDAMNAIADRVARIEQRMDTEPDSGEGPAFDPRPITDVLNAISTRLTSMESRVEKGPDVTALTSFLDMVNQRLERMETGLGKTTAAPPRRAVLTRTAPPLRPAATSAPTTVPVAPAPPAAPPLSPTAAAEEAVAQAAAPAGENAEAPRQQVDKLLEQVLKVLSR